MGKVSDEERSELEHIIENDGLHRLKSRQEFSTCMDNCMEGFRKNPLFSYLCGGEFDEIILKELMCRTYESFEKSAIAYTDSEDLNACAVWVPSGLSAIEVFRGFKEVGVKLYRLGGARVIRRLLSYESSVNFMKKSITNNNDWYLHTYECKNEYDNDETFIKMVEPIVNYAWSAGRACYIECSVESRMAPLMKMGFHIVDTVSISKTKQKLYGMMV